jgi:hypothetical protein
MEVGAVSSQLLHAHATKKRLATVVIEVMDPTSAGAERVNSALVLRGVDVDKFQKKHLAGVQYSNLPYSPEVTEATLTFETMEVPDSWNIKHNDPFMRKARGDPFMRKSGGDPG